MADINGDGFDDLFIGNTKMAREQFEPDSIHVFYGGERRYQGTTDLTASDAVLEHRSIERVPEVMGAGDITGDGIEDVFIGLNLFRSSGLIDYSGLRLSLVEGRHGGLPDTLDLSEADRRLHSRDGVLFFPSRPGDFNGDGLPDRIFAPSHHVMVISGRRDDAPGVRSLEDAVDFEIRANADHDTGTGFAVNGDINGDGYDDVVLQQPRSVTYDEFAPGKSAFIYYGRPTSEEDVERWTHADAVLHGPDQGEEHRASLSLDVGHFNADRYADIALCSWPERKLYIVFGGP